MTYRLELYVRFADGTGRIDSAERDEPEGRRTTDHKAFELLERPDVVEVRVERTLRTAYGKRGGTR